MDTIDAWRIANWHKTGSCWECGDPIILADTEDWSRSLCYACWDEMGCPDEESEADTNVR